MGGNGKVFTLAEVSAHNSPKDCWLVVEGRVPFFFSFPIFFTFPFLAMMGL
jgi:hypothetical protein